MKKRIVDSPKKLSVDSWLSTDHWEFLPRVSFYNYLNCCELHIGFLSWLCIINIRKNGW